MSRTPTTAARLTLEPMEDRSLPAATLTAALDADGTLRVEGTEAADWFEVRHSGDAVYVGGLPQAFPAGQVQRIALDLLGGDDRLWLNAEWNPVNQPLAKPTAIRGGAGNDQIVGGWGADVILGGAGDDVVWSYHGADVVSGDGGSDQLIGGTGGDVLDGGDGADHVWGEDGDDVVAGGQGPTGSTGRPGATPPTAGPRPTSSPAGTGTTT